MAFRKDLHPTQETNEYDNINPFKTKRRLLYLSIYRPSPYRVVNTFI